MNAPSPRPTLPTLYDQLCQLPDNLVGELLHGQLETQPRPSAQHGLTESALLFDLGPPFHHGRGGPGGWWIIVEPEVHFVRDQVVTVPDIAGWRRERMPKLPKGHRVEVVPDWICEILSPSTAYKDREIKLPIYAEYGVGFAWLVDPIEKTLEAYERSNSSWAPLGTWRANDVARIRPFEAIELALTDLWSE